MERAHDPSVPRRRTRHRHAPRKTAPCHARDQPGLARAPVRVGPAIADRMHTRVPSDRSFGVPSRSTGATIVGVATNITQRELRNNSGEIMRQLDRGESFVVTRNGVPVGELSPLRRHRFVSAAAAVAVFRGAPRVEFDRFRADLDAVANQEIAPRG